MPSATGRGLPATRGALRYFVGGGNGPNGPNGEQAISSEDRLDLPWSLLDLRRGSSTRSVHGSCFGVFALVALAIGALDSPRARRRRCPWRCGIDPSAQVLPATPIDDPPEVAPSSGDSIVTGHPLRASSRFGVAPLAKACSRSPRPRSDPGIGAVDLWFVAAIDWVAVA
ncbi:MAG: hypothetical protein JW751_18140 [Polyangiaceae bacterium]|nr:hypothetical protein [Polyangiaceae bacterium]